MRDEALRSEVDALREKVARLEEEHATPVKVDVEGFEGLRQLSHAIETKNLDAFMLDRGIPDRWFWGMVGLMVAFAIPVVVIIALSYAGIWVR